jgi:hypothetical protein
VEERPEASTLFSHPFIATTESSSVTEEGITFSNTMLGTLDNTNDSHLLPMTNISPHNVRLLLSSVNRIYILLEIYPFLSKDQSM